MSTGLLPAIYANGGHVPRHFFARTSAQVLNDYLARDGERNVDLVGHCTELGPERHYAFKIN